METHQTLRLQHILSHLDNSSSQYFNINLFEQNLNRIFNKTSPFYEIHNINSNGLFLNACNAEHGEPNDRFVNLSRDLQKDTSMGYNNVKGLRKKKKNTNEVKIEPSQLDKLFDPKILLGVASTGIALAFLPSSSPVSRGLLSRLWPHIIQFAIAYLVHIRRKQDVKDNLDRSHVVLYIATALLQFFTAIRDFKGHSLSSFSRRLLLGPIDPLLEIMKSILLSLPSFLFKTVLLSGISIIGKVTVFGLLIVGIIAALGFLIVVIAENL